MSEETIKLIAIVFGVIIFIKLIKEVFDKNIGRNKNTNNTNLPYTRKDYFLTIPERQFFETLQSIVWDSHIIVPQVVLSSIIRTTSDKKSFWKRQNRINKKTLDFVIFSKPYLQPLVAIEYDWITHEKKDRIERDSFVDATLKTSWIEIIHHKHKISTTQELQTQLSKILNLQ